MATKTYPEAIAHLPLTQQAVIIRIYNRVIKDNKNALIAVTGGTGSGKSYAVLSIMVGLYQYENGEDPPLEYMKHHCVFRSREFLERINNPNLKPLECWMFDEAGVDINSKNHASNHNKALNFVVQTFRHLQQIVFFTVPSFSFMDKSVRNMIHYKLETISINKQNKTNKCKFFKLQYNERQDKLYFKYIKVRKNGYSAKVQRINTLLAPKPLVDQYEEQKSQYSGDLREKIEMSLAKADAKERKELSMEKEELSDPQTRVWNELVKGYRSPSVIANILGCSPSNVSGHILKIKKKGYILPNSEKMLEKSDLEANSLKIAPH